MIPEKKKLNQKLSTPRYYSQVKKGIKNTKKAVLSFKFVKTQIMSGSQDQKERKTASTVTTIFLEQKITSAQIRFCNDR